MEYTPAITEMDHKHFEINRVIRLSESLFMNK